jgi:molybdopterin converting factor small subunit
LTNSASEVIRDATSTTKVTGIALKIEVSIKFFGMQRVLTKTDGIDMPITEKARVTDALEYVRERYPELPLDKETVLITVNHEQASLDTMLKPNDIVSFLPYICGG